VAVTNLKALVDRLNTTCRRALEGAAGLCLSRTNYNVEIEHWLLKLLEVPTATCRASCGTMRSMCSRVTRELSRSLDGLKTGNARKPELSIEIIDWMREAWVLTSLEYGAGRIRSGYMLAALLNDRTLGTRTRSASAELAKLQPERLQKEVPALATGTAEDAEAGIARWQASPARPRPVVELQDAFARSVHLDLTALAAQGKIDPVIGREWEIRQVIDILTRRRRTIRS